MNQEPPYPRMKACFFTDHQARLLPNQPRGVGTVSLGRLGGYHWSGFHSANPFHLVIVFRIRPCQTHHQLGPL